MRGMGRAHTLTGPLEARKQKKELSLPKLGTAPSLALKPCALSHLHVKPFQESNFLENKNLNILLQ